MVQGGFKFKVLVTGGAGFIGTWVIRKLLEMECDVYVIDNLSNGDIRSLEEFRSNKHLCEAKIGDIRNKNLLSELFHNEIDICIHLAALVNVQKSIINPVETFDVNLKGTINLLEAARREDIKFLLISTCMVYDTCNNGTRISEKHPIKPKSPYAASKLAAEHVTLAYYYSYSLPVAILRPFNTYGPHQKSTAEGGVISVFIEKKLKNQMLEIFGNGLQTRDFIYASDCANFIVKAAFSGEVVGNFLNAGSGKDVSINKLALSIVGDAERIKHVQHPHPQSEINKLLCDYQKAKKLLGWKPKIPLEEGIRKTEQWIKSNVITK